MNLPKNHPWIPQSRERMGWMEEHKLLVQQTLKYGKNKKIIFIGDSITRGWGESGIETWKKYYSGHRALYYGIGGDRTQHLLYRIENKEFDGLRPEVIVLMIGTNNLESSDTVEDIAHGVKEILHQLTLKMSEAKIILLGLLPRNEPLATKAKQVNSYLAELAIDKTVYWLDMWQSFLTPEGQLNTALYAEGNLHIGATGYEVWHKTMVSLLTQLHPFY